MTEARYRIGAAARLSGVSAHLIRVWERRYGVLSPDRSDGGARLYSDHDVERLKLLKRAVGEGHAIGQVAPLDEEQLQRLVGAHNTPTEPRTPASSAALLDELMAAVECFDAPVAEQILDRAQANYSARALLQEVFAPLLTRIGDQWAAGKLCAANEHAATALIRSRAGALLRQFMAPRSAAMVLVSTPAGELHELGALLAAVSAAMQGLGVLYLGPNLPASEIALAARTAGVSLVVLSVISLAPQAVAHELQLIVEQLPRHIEVVVGGSGAKATAAHCGVPIHVAESLPDFEQWLAQR